MSKNIYVGNLPWSSTEDEVRAAFEAYGQVSSVKLIEDRETGRPRGFGFVEMEDDSAALEAIEALDGKEFDGRNIKVNEAKPREPRRGGGGHLARMSGKQVGAAMGEAEQDLADQLQQRGLARFVRPIDDV